MKFGLLVTAINIIPMQKLFQFSLFLICLIAINPSIFSQCAQGNIAITQVNADFGTGSYNNPASGKIEIEFCYTLNEFFERSTNWAHGVFIEFDNIPSGFRVIQGSTGVQKTQAGSRFWIYVDSTQAKASNLPGPGYYVDNSDGDPTNNYGDNGIGTPNATFPNLAPFCLKLLGSCTVPKIINPCMTVTGDGTTGAWRNPDCPGDEFCASTTGPNNDGTVVICGFLLSTQLIQFNAAQFNTSNKIEWSATTDKQFDHYELEKSTDDKNHFEKIENFYLSQTELLLNQHNKTYLDLSPNYQTYYRLKMIDKSGASTYSPIRQVANHSIKNENINVQYYNINNSLQININNSNSTSYQLDIYAINSTNVYSESIHSNKQNYTSYVNTATMPKGMYFVRLINENNITKIYKFIK